MIEIGNFIKGNDVAKKLNNILLLSLPYKAKCSSQELYVTNFIVTITNNQRNKLEKNTNYSTRDQKYKEELLSTNFRNNRHYKYNKWKNCKD